MGVFLDYYIPKKVVLVKPKKGEPPRGEYSWKNLFAKPVFGRLKLHAITDGRMAYKPEKAPSDRSHCKACKIKIPKGMLRFNVTYRNGRYITSKTICCLCGFEHIETEFLEFSKVVRSYRSYVKKRKEEIFHLRGEAKRRLEKEAIMNMLKKEIENERQARIRKELIIEGMKHERYHRD